MVSPLVTQSLISLLFAVSTPSVRIREGVTTVEVGRVTWLFTDGDLGEVARTAKLAKMSQNDAADTIAAALCQSALEELSSSPREYRLVGAYDGAVFVQLTGDRSTMEAMCSADEGDLKKILSGRRKLIPAGALPQLDEVRYFLEAASRSSAAGSDSEGELIAEQEGQGEEEDLETALEEDLDAAPRVARQGSPDFPRQQTFAEWSAKAENRKLVAALKELLTRERQVRSALAEYKREKSSNDDNSRAPSFHFVPVFPEATGAFTFVKILDRYDAEALFSASDGMFVLRLSPGDSFNAYPGQLVQMTLHFRGERMLMTTGVKLPVAWSGHAPTSRRFVPGVTPSRAKERKLLRRAERLASDLRQYRRTRFGAHDSGLGHLKNGARQFPHLVLRGEAGQLEEVGLTLSEGTEEAFSIRYEGDTAADCNAAVECVSVEEVLGNDLPMQGAGLASGL